LFTPSHGDLLQREVLWATRERMLREIGEALEAIASRHPLLIVLEDLQWADDATVDLISVLTRRRVIDFGLADSLAAEDALRDIWLSSPAVRQIVGQK
jgi:predicted ATPase